MLSLDAICLLNPSELIDYPKSVFEIVNIYTYYN